MPNQQQIDKFQQAEKMFGEGKLAESGELYISLTADSQLAPICYYRLAHISNATQDPETAYGLYYKAFTLKPDIMNILTANDHPNNRYVFNGKKDEKEKTSCTLCGGEGEPRWCYPLPEVTGYNPFFNPVRMWMYCKQCHHMYAKNFPEKLFIHNNNPRTPNTQFFTYYSDILSRLQQYAQGMTLFEIGIGACECLLAAHEIGYEVFGVDVIDLHVQMAKEKFGLQAETCDFVEYETDKKWDVIIMGDVIEHVSDPDLALNKAANMLSENGALWVSTPNFDSAFSRVAGHSDPMRRQQYHLNYFSRESFYMLLERNHLIPVEYKISGHYNGSMEIIAVSESRLNG